MRSAFRKYWPFLLLIALTVVFLGDIWFGGRMLLLRDFFWNEGPNHFYLGKVLRSGHFPIWNSLWQAGVPNAAQPYYGTFYPPNWMFILPWGEWVIRLWWTFHFAVAAMSMYALCRYWRLSVAPALLAAISFAFGTYMMAWVEFAHGFSCMPWIPLGFLFVSRIIDATATASPASYWGSVWAALRGNVGSVIALAVVFALQGLASAEYVYYSALLVAGYVISKWIWLRSGRVVAVSGMLIIVAAIIAVGLALPQLILTFELIQQSTRTGEMDSLSGMCSAHPRHWLTLLLPYLYGKPGYPAEYWAKNIFEFASGTFYIGILPLIGVFFSGMRSGEKPDRERRFLFWYLIALVGIGLTMAAGDFTPVYKFLHHWFPGLGRLRFPTKFYLFAVLGLSILGGMGLQSVLDGEGKRGKLRWWIATGCFAVFVLGFLLCYADKRFLTLLMASPQTPTVIQVNDAFLDYALAAWFACTGLILFGLLVFRRGSVKPVCATIVGIAFANLCLISRQAQPTAPSGIYTRRPKALAEAIHADPLYRFLSPYNPAQQYTYGDSRADIFDWVREGGSSNHILLEGVQSLATGGMALGRYAEIFSLLEETPPEVQDKWCDILALRYSSLGTNFREVFWRGGSQEISLGQREKCLPRAFVVERWRVVPDENRIVETICRDGFDPQNEAVIEPLPGQTIPAVASAKPGTFRPVDRFEDRNDSSLVEMTVKQRALLVLSDTWYPGWTAKVDGVPAPIFRANYLFRGVFLEPGKHRVEFSYTPTHFSLAVWIFAFTVAGCGALVWASRGAKPAAIPVSEPLPAPQKRRKSKKKARR